MNELSDKTLFRDKPRTPVTPYQKAAEAWDERIGSARVQARNWRLVALLSLALLSLMTVFVVRLSSTTRIQPYIIEVGNRGQVASVARIDEIAVKPDERMIRYFLIDVLQRMRSLPLDPVMAKQNWLRVYEFLSPEARLKMNEVAQLKDPFADLGSRTRSVIIENLVRLSPTSYQIRWREQVFAAKGGFLAEDRFTGAFTFAVAPPETDTQIRKNPLGLYITHFDITKDQTS